MFLWDVNTLGCTTFPQGHLSPWRHHRGGVATRWSGLWCHQDHCCIMLERLTVPFWTHISKSSFTPCAFVCFYSRRWPEPSFCPSSPPSWDLCSLDTTSVSLMHLRRYRNRWSQTHNAQKGCWKISPHRSKQTKQKSWHWCQPAGKCWFYIADGV